MATLAILNKQIATLQRKADAIRKAEVAQAVKQVKQLVARHGLTAEDVGLAGAAGRGGAKGKSTAWSVVKPLGVAKYRDPQTGKTWTGKGKPPNWISGVADRSLFLIEQQAGATRAQAASASEPAEPGKSRAKPAKSAEKASASKRVASGAKPAGKASSRTSNGPAKKAAAAPKASKRAAKKSMDAGQAQNAEAPESSEAG